MLLKDLELLKKRNYQRYIEYLLTYDLETLGKELKNLKPCENQILNEVSTNISWYYASIKNYSKALDWDSCKEKIDIKTKLFWYSELKEYQKMKEVYHSYIQKNPDDEITKIAMADMLLGINMFKDSWIIGISLKESSEKEQLRSKLNNDVIYLERKILKDLVDNYSSFFYPDVLQRVKWVIRESESNSIEYNSILEQNDATSTFFSHEGGYSFYDNKKRSHTISVTQSNVYKLSNEISEPANIDHELYGIQYKFKYLNNNKKRKIDYWAKGRLEKDETGKLYYQFGTGINLTKLKNYGNVNLLIYPVKTGPAHSLDIYRFQLSLYKEYNIKSRYQYVFLSENNYFTDDIYQLSLTNRFLLLPKNKKKKHSFYPFIEASYTYGTVNRQINYPYWLIEKNLNAGMGLGYEIGKEFDKFKMKIRGTALYDDYSNYIGIITGSSSYRIFGSTILTGKFELFKITNFYSNTFQFGLKYFLP